MAKSIDLIRTAIEALGVYAPGETMTDADAERGLSVLNGLLDGWSNQPQACFAFLTQSFTLQTNKTSYTIGPSVLADINGTRPLKIVQAFMVDTLNNQYPIAIIGEWEWNQIINKQINGQVPSVMFYDPQDPIGIINVWPSPLLPWTMNIVTHLQLSAFPNLFADVILPRGYVPALSYNLAIELAPFFGKVPHPTLVEMASRYLADIKRVNAVDVLSVYDSELWARGHSYNILNDSMGGSRGFG